LQGRPARTGPEDDGQQKGIQQRGYG